VSIDEHVYIGLDIGEHPPHDVAFALQRLAAHKGSSCERQIHRAIGGIVIEDKNPRLRQDRTEVADHFGDGGLFVVAGDEDGDARCRKALLRRTRAGHIDAHSFRLTSHRRPDTMVRCGPAVKLT